MKASRSMGKRALIALAIMSTGCAVGPNYSGVRSGVPESYSESASVTTTQPSTQPTADLANWWGTFRDPILDGLIRRAVAANRDLRTASERVREARALRGVAEAGYYPTVTANGSYTNSRASRNTGFNTGINGNTGGGTGTGGIPAAFSPDRDTDLWQAGFDASWEIDVFGAVRRNVEATEADFAASVEDRRDVLVTVLGDVAQNYVELRGAQQQLEITRKNIRIQDDTLGLTRSRFQAGLVSEVEVARSQAQVFTTTAQLPAAETNVRTALHRLGVLVGEEPGALRGELLSPAAIPASMENIPLGLPSELLRRRPDIRRAERDLAAATARVGVATADLFPRFTLNGSFGQQSTLFRRLADSGSNFWSIGPNISIPIFNGGRLRQNVAVADARARQSESTYEQTVLLALEEVDNAIVAFDRERQRLGSLQQAVESNERAVDLSKQRFERGIGDFLSVLDAERDLFQAEDLMVQSRRSVSVNLVAIYKALGGGWESMESESPSTRPAMESYEKELSGR